MVTDVKAAGIGPGVMASGAVAVCLGAATVIAMSFGVTYNWPDYQHTNYGFPWVWGTHTTDTFIGPVDQWTVSLGNLALDLVLWLAALSIAVVVASLVLGHSSRGGSTGADVRAATLAATVRLS
jgi:hypothetical protein